MEKFLAKNPQHQPPAEVLNGIRGQHEEVPLRMDVIEEALLSSGSKIVYPGNFIPVPPELLRKIHSPDYVDYILGTTQSEEESYRYPSVFPPRRSGFTEQINGKLGYYSFDMYTPVNNKVTEAAITAASGAYNAASAVLNGNRTAYAIGRPPGHHAGFDFMGGYCYLNNAAVAAALLSSRGKIGILDIDYHHGNGTEDIFRTLQEEQQDPRVLTVSIHADPDRKFPYFSGYTTAPESPSWKGINYALPPDVTNREYDQILHQALKKLSDHQPNFLVIPVGFDTHERDPLGDFKLTTTYYEQIAKNIMSLELPTVFIQEGGYNLDTIGDNILSFIRGVEV